jgi:hypothetical protein
VSNETADHKFNIEQTSHRALQASVTLLNLHLQLQRVFLLHHTIYVFVIVYVLLVIIRALRLVIHVLLLHLGLLLHLVLHLVVHVAYGLLEVHILQSIHQSVIRV